MGAETHSGWSRLLPGFGFVVFEDKQMVDLLIKPDARTFVPLSDGRQLEVKRALSAAALRPRHRA